MSKNVTAAATGTSYTISSPATATISPDGLVTARASGTVIISALNDGALGMIQLRVQLSGDSDNDGIPDDLEIANGLNPNNPVDAEEDGDLDGLTNKEELQTFGTNMRLADTDGDGIRDGEEVVAGQDGFVTSPLLADTDGDGVRDLLEIQTGSDPTNRNSLNLAQALQSFEVTPASFVLTVNTIIGEASRQLTVTGHLKDGTTIDLTATTRGTTYSSSDLFIVNFGTPDGRVFAGNTGTATITVANSGFSQVVDVTVRTSSPQTLGFVSIPGFANNVDVAGNYAYVAAGSAGLQVVDVSDRRSPRVVAALDTPGNANDVRVVGNLAYVADGASGLQIIFVGNPLTPGLVGSVDTPGLAWDVAVNGNRCYVADGASGLHVVDVTQPNAPAILGSVRTLGAAKGVSVSGNVAVVAEGDAGIQVIDVSDPLNPAVLSARSTGGDARDVEVLGNFAYVADFSRSFTVIGLADLRNPQLLASTPSSTGGLLQDVAMDGRFALGADVFFVNGVPIIDIQNPANPIPRAILDFRSFRDDNGTGIAVDGSYVYMTAERGISENGVSGDTRLYVGQYLAIDDTRGVPPIVRIEFPQSGVTYIEGQTVTVQVLAEDDVGVASVSLFANGVIVNSDTVAPYEFNFTVPGGVSQVSFAARAVDFGGNQSVSADAVIGVIPDPGTTVIGRVINESGQAVGGAAVAVFNTYTSISLADGNFSIPGVPTIRGNFRVSASAQVGDVVLRGTSLNYEPVPGGVVNIGDMVIRPIQNQGREFILVFQQNHPSVQPILQVFISSEEATVGFVEIPGLAFSQNFSATPGNVTAITVPTTGAVSVADAVINRGIHVISERPISVYGLNQAPFTTDAYAALPVETFGTQYRPMSYGPTSGSQFSVVAAEDNTTVTIVPSASASTRVAGQAYTIGLNRYEVYQLRASSGDLTGSRIVSDKPVGVFSGHTCANVPPGFAACDHLCEQIPPVNTWGQVALTVPLATRTRGDTFRILADQPDTDIAISGPAPATARLQPGQFHEVILTGNNVISASKPILVAQFSNGTLFDNVTSDPFMMLIPPAEQFLRNYTFATPGSGFAINFVNVVVLAEDALGGRVLLDGAPISATAFTAIVDSGFMAARLSIGVGTHTVSSSNPVGIYVYGFASADSYGYPGGMALQVR